VDAIKLTQVRGLPFGSEELADAIREVATSVDLDVDPVKGAAR
jgi:hypothetical protein